MPGGAVHLLGLRMQADVPGVHTLYDAVHLANNADGSAGDTAVVGSMQVARHADGDQRHDDAQRAGERIGPAAAWCRRASDGVDTATAIVTFNIAAAPVSPSGGDSRGGGCAASRELRLFSGLLVAAGRRRVAAAPARRSVRIAVAGPAGRWAARLRADGRHGGPGHAGGVRRRLSSRHRSGWPSARLRRHARCPLMRRARGHWRARLHAGFFWHIIRKYLQAMHGHASESIMIDISYGSTSAMMNNRVPTMTSAAKPSTAMRSFFSRSAALASRQSRWLLAVAALAPMSLAWGLVNPSTATATGASALGAGHRAAAPWGDDR